MHTCGHVLIAQDATGYNINESEDNIDHSSSYLPRDRSNSHLEEMVDNRRDPYLPTDRSHLEDEYDSDQTLPSGTCSKSLQFLLVN